MKQKPTIECQKNGPYIVRNVDRVVDSEGKLLGKKEERRLCRCGASTHKPFCDGSHIMIDFNDQEDQSPDKNVFDRYIGKEATIYFNQAICSDAGDCYNKLPSVFGTRKNRTIDPDGEAPGAIRRLVDDCPSGAFFCTTDDQQSYDQKFEPGIISETNGPYRVQGGIEMKSIEMSDRHSIQQYTLCRCGGSKAKPFCDGTHKKNGFRDDRLLAIIRVEAVNKELTRVTIGKKELVIVKQSGVLSVFSGICLHAEALMVGGFIEQNYLVCGRHRWRYDLETGELDGDPSMVLKKLRSHVENGWLLIERVELDELKELDED